MIRMSWVKARCKPEGNCLVWQLAVSVGHPRYCFRQPDGTRAAKQMRRVVWELRNGPIPQGMFVAVNCGCTACLRPTHLELVDKSEVVRRAWAQPETARRKFLAGVRANREKLGKLDMDKARYIRSSDKTLQALAGELSVSVALVSMVRRGLRWREVVANPFSGLGART